MSFFKVYGNAQGTSGLVRFSSYRFLTGGFLALTMLLAQFAATSAFADVGGDPHTMSCTLPVTAGTHTMPNGDPSDTLDITNAAIGAVVVITFTPTTGTAKTASTTEAGGGAAASGPVPANPIDITANGTPVTQTWTVTAAGTLNFTLTRTTNGTDWNATCTPPAPGITVNTTDNAATEGGGTGAFTIVLNSAPTANVTVTIAADPASPDQCIFSAASLTFTTANWSIPQSVTVTAVNDTLVEGAHTCTTGAITASATGGYTGVTGTPKFLMCR